MRRQRDQKLGEKGFRGRERLQVNGCKIASGLGDADESTGSAWPPARLTQAARSGTKRCQ